MYIAAQQVAHAAQTIDWFIEGATRPEGFDLNFEQHFAALMGVDSLKAAREWLWRSYESAQRVFGGMTEAELGQPLPEGPVMGGLPKSQVIGAIAEHTAHHRGALTVYSRLLGKTPMMPYAET
jgi:uncharacterized damage-inducible protein DinB